MTKTDFILGIITSLIASILFELRHKIYAYLQKLPRKRLNRQFLKKTQQAVNDALVVGVIVFHHYKKQINSLRPAFAFSLLSLVIFLITYLSYLEPAKNRDIVVGNVVPVVNTNKIVPDEVAFVPKNTGGATATTGYDCGGEYVRFRTLLTEKSKDGKVIIGYDVPIISKKKGSKKTPIIPCGKVSNERKELA